MLNQEGSHVDDETVLRFQQLGFGEEEIRTALLCFEGDVERAGSERVILEWPADGAGACPVGTCVPVAAHFAAAGWAPNITGSGEGDYDYEYGNAEEADYDYEYGTPSQALAHTPANNTFLAARFADALASGDAVVWFPSGVLDTRLDAVSTDHADFLAGALSGDGDTGSGF